MKRAGTRNMCFFFTWPNDWKEELLRSVSVTLHLALEKALSPSRHPDKRQSLAPSDK